MMKISVIVPVYNVKEYLPKCLDSLYIQDIDMEVILVNDGSTDGSYEICQQYAQKYKNTVLINKKNGGLSDARNIGVEKAVGDFVYFLDSDDWISPDAIKLLYNFAVTNDCDIVQSGFYYAYSTYLLYDKLEKDTKVLCKEEAVLELIKNDYVKNFAWGKLYRSDIVKRHLFPKGRYFEDSFWQHHILHECNKYGIVPNPLYYYRQRNSSISGEFSMRNIDLIRGYENRLAFIQREYPQYIEQMAFRLWKIGYEMYTIAKNTKTPEIKQEYNVLWKDLNKKYARLFDKSLESDVQYCLWKSCPILVPIYNLCDTLYARFSDCGRFEKVMIMDNKTNS